MRELLYRNLRLLSIDLGIDYQELHGNNDDQRLDSLLRRIVAAGRLEEFTRIARQRCGVDLPPDLLTTTTENNATSSVSIVGSGGIVGQSVTISAGQLALGDMYVDYRATSFADLRALLERVREEISNASAPEAQEASKHLEEAISETNKLSPDKKTITESLSKAGRVLDSITDTALKAGRLGSLLASAMKALSYF